MPSVFTLTSAKCPWQLKKGRKVKGCYRSEREAREHANGGWRPMFSRPPGVPVSAAHPTRAGQRGMTPGGKRWHRSLHEERAIEEIDYVNRTLRWSWGGCSTTGVYTVSKLNKAVARARCHLAAIGPDAGPRIRKLWRVAGRAQKRVDDVTNKLAKCLL